MVSKWIKEAHGIRCISSNLLYLILPFPFYKKDGIPANMYVYVSAVFERHSSARPHDVWRLSRESLYASNGLTGGRNATRPITQTPINASNAALRQST